MLISIIIFALFLYFVIGKDYFKSIPSAFSKKEKNMTIEDKYNSRKASEQNELNTLLEKVNRKGYENLAAKEKSRLDELSKN